MKAHQDLVVGVPAGLLGLPAIGGHGKVWHRVLAALRQTTPVVPIHPPGRASRATPFGRPALLRRGSKPNVVLANGHTDLPRTRLPIVVQVHEAGWFTEELQNLLSPDFLGHIAQRTEHAVHAAAHVITPSESARRDVIDAYALDPRSVHAVHHGVDTTFKPDAQGGRRLVAGARGGRDAPYVLYAATLHPRKNLPVLREAMAGLAGEGFPHVLAIAGMAAPDRLDSSQLESAAAAELPGIPGRVVRLGQPSDDELAALMAEADAFCLPSLYEGFGLTVLEAMACGAPVIVSDRGALPEVVGDAGVVVEPTAEAVRDALRTVLQDVGVANRLRAAAVHRARGFTWERTAAGWREVLCSAAVEATRGAHGQPRHYTRRR